MARRYARDNRGRFASGGGGATARGGRLRTAAGNKRATQTMTAKGAGGAGVMKGAVKRDPGAMAKVGKAAPKTPKGKKADYAGAVALLSSQKAAINRLKQPMQTFNGNAAYGRNLDRLRAKSTPMANAQRDIKAALGAYRRTQSTKANELASPETKQRNRRELPGLRKKVVKAVRTARALKPEFAAETKRRFQARQAKAPKPAAPAQAKAAPKAMLPKSLLKPGVDKGAAFMRFMDRAQAIPGKRKAQSANDYNLTRRNRKTAKSMATSKKAEAYVFGLRGKLLGR